MLLTRLPLMLQFPKASVRLACVKHAASVHPEPGSNSPLNMFTSRGPRFTKCDPVLSGVVHLLPVRRPRRFGPKLVSCRFGLLIDPIDMTGLCDSQCEPNWLVTVSGFQGSGCGGFPAYPAVLPAACRPTRVRRQGDTLPTRPRGVNGYSGLSWVASPELVRDADHRRQKRLPRFAGRRRSGAAAHVAAAGTLWFRLPIPAGFQHTLQCPNDLRRCGAVLYQRTLGGASAHRDAR